MTKPSGYTPNFTGRSYKTLFGPKKDITQDRHGREGSVIGGRELVGEDSEVGEAGRKEGSSGQANRIKEASTSNAARVSSGDIIGKDSTSANTWEIPSDEDVEMEIVHKTYTYHGDGSVQLQPSATKECSGEDAVGEGSHYWKEGLVDRGNPLKAVEMVDEKQEPISSSHVNRIGKSVSLVNGNNDTPERKKGESSATGNRIFRKQSTPTVQFPDVVSAPNGGVPATTRPYAAHHDVENTTPSRAPQETDILKVAIEDAVKVQKELDSILESDCEKEIASIRIKYDLLRQEAASVMALTKSKIESCHQLLLKRKLLGDAIQKQHASIQKQLNKPPLADVPELNQEERASLITAAFVRTIEQRTKSASVQQKYVEPQTATGQTGKCPAAPVLQAGSNSGTYMRPRATRNYRPYFNNLV